MPNSHCQSAPNPLRIETTRSGRFNPLFKKPDVRLGGHVYWLSKFGGVLDESLNGNMDTGEKRK